MKKPLQLKQVLAALLTIVAVMVGHQAMASDKTVTYTISYTGTNTMVLTPNVAGFDGSSEPITGPAITGSNSNFGLFLHDNLEVIVNLYQSSGDHRMYISNNGVTFNYAATINVACSSYYITHIAMKDHNGTAIVVFDPSLPPQEQTNFSFDLNVDIDKIGASGAPSTVTDYHIRTANSPSTIKTITITYGESPRGYNIRYINAVNGQNGVTNGNRRSYNVTTSDFNITAPTRTGYDFDGFTYTDAAHPTATEATLPMTISRGEAATRKEINFNASWTTHTYTLRLHHNDGSNDYTDMAMTYDVAANIQTITRTGYTFANWSTNPDGTGTTYTEGQSVSNLTDVNGAVIDIYAQWTAHTYTLRLHHNDGSNDYTDMAMTYDVAANLQTITRTGYTFANWSTNPDGSGTTYTEGQSVSNLTDVNGAIVDLYAQWTAHTYTLRLHHNDGSNDYTDMAMTYDVAANIQTVTRTGYTFANWSTNPDGSGTTYTESQSVSNLTDVNGAIVDLYAQWTVNTYTLRLHHNDGSNDYTDMAMTYDVAANLQTITRTGYTFANWSTNPDGTGTTYYEGQSVSNLTDVNGAIVDLYAQWTAHTYTVHFDANYDNNGIVISGTMENQTFTYGQGVLNANAFTRTGYTFAGWNTEADGTGTTYTDQQASPNVTPDNDAIVTLYAQWNVTPWTGSGTTENDPFVILYASQLMKLSNDVNRVGGTHYDGKYFKLGNNIDMNGVAFDGIGTGNDINHSFDGNFNGDGKTISNVTVNMSNQDNVGFFGTVHNATIRNLILDGASITGNTTVGVLVGYVFDNGSIENCLVMNSSVTYTNEDYIGVICGYISITYATLTGNHYYNCTLTNGNQTYTTNIGVGDFSSSYDIDGARSIHTLTLPEQVSVASATESVTYDEVTYYASTSTVTFNHNDLPNGYMPTYSASAGTVNGNTLTMPDQDVTVTASLVALTYNITYDLAGGSVATANPTTYTVNSPDITLNNPTLEGYTFAGWTGTDLDEPTMTVTIAQGSTGDRSYTATWSLLPVTYIDADGVAQTLYDYTLLEGSDEFIEYGEYNTEAWYVVAHDVTYNEGIRFYGSANLILMDGATLTVRRVSVGHNYLLCDTDLTIYVQSGGTGAIVGENIRISSGSITIHGGQISVETEGDNGIRASSNLTINGGVVSVTETADGTAIYSDHVVINGGVVTTTNQQGGYGIDGFYELTINGGVVTTTNQQGGYGIYSYYEVTINGGVVTTTNQQGGYGIYSYYEVTINGGLVTANATEGAYGIRAGEYYPQTITLGWTDETDRITSDSYYGEVTIATGQAFVDGAGNYYLSTLTDSQVAAMSGQTLIPFDDFDTPFAINYETNGGTLPSGYPATYTYTETVTLPTPTKEDNNFWGWYDNAAFEGEPVTEITAGTTLGAKTFYAYWAPKHTDVTYLDADGQPQTVRATILYGEENNTGVYEGGVYSVLDMDGYYAAYDLLRFTGDATLILPDGGGLYVAVGKGATDSEEYGLFVEGNLTIYGQEKGNGYNASWICEVDGNVNIYGGEVFLYNLTLNADSDINLSWTGLQNYIFINPTQGNVHLLKDFVSEQTVLHAGDPVAIADLCNHYLYPYAETIDVSYIDENGDEHIAHDAQVLWGNETSLPGGTYTFIKSWLEFNHEVTFGGNTTIIVPDNLDISLKNPDGNYMTVNGDLAIYGQEERTGDFRTNMVDGIHATGDVTVSNVKANIYKIFSGGDILIAGGKQYYEYLGANGGNGTITLGYLTEDDYIYNNDYAGTVVIRAGQTMTTGYDYLYSGTLTSDQVAEIEHDYLKPYLTPITITVEGYGESNGGWVFIASPMLKDVKPTEVGNIFSATEYDLYRFDQSQTDEEWQNFVALPNSLVNGQGYLYASKETVELSFNGVANPASSEELTLNAGWNLVGNPFASNATLNREYYVMNQDGTGINPEPIPFTTPIPPCTAVFVKAENDGETVVFSRVTE